MSQSWWTELRQELPSKLAHLRVGIYATAGAPYHHGALAALWGAMPRMVSVQEILEGVLGELDVIVFPGGGLSAMSGMLAPLSPSGAALVRRFVAEGGMYIGSCAGSFLPVAVAESFREVNPASREMFMVRARLANGADSGWDGLTSPGVGVLEVEISQGDHWLSLGLPKRFEIVHYNGPAFLTDCPLETIRQPEDPSEPAVGVIRFTKPTGRFTAWENTLSQSPNPRPSMVDYIEQGTYSVVTAGYRRGTVVLFGSHPEFGFNAIQLGWGPACRLYANALKYQAARRVDLAAQPFKPALGDPKTLRAQLKQAQDQLLEHATQFRQLLSFSGADWLEPGRAPGFQGLTPREVWRRSLEDAAQACEQTAQYLEALASSARDQDLLGCEFWINQAERGSQDYGFIGLMPLLEKMAGLIAQGQARLEAAPLEPSSPYDAWLEHPYHLLTSTYLSATGLAACASLCAVMIGTLINPELPLPAVLVSEASGFAHSGKED